uniref:alpha-L-fucosidase n=1 Tax=mine drainage metagenome TaxID=410659 RepID=E6PYP6_9ZZZZ
MYGQSGSAAASSAFHDFNTLTEDYARFCATPAADRLFYALENGRILSEKLAEGDWKPTGWGDPPSLPIPGGSWDGVPMESPIAGLSGDGPYKPTWDSLMDYEAPEWYQDAKFGMWAHWSPQCVPEDGDWYARNMYIQGSAQYKYHLEHYGHPSKFGYKDLCDQWTLLNWEPEALIERYKRAGARFFLCVANHHDSFDCWDSRHQPWNAVHYGPRRDVVGTWAAAARERGLRFGVTVHQARNWWWFQTAHGADATGPYAGVPYDGRMTAANGKGQWWEGLDPHRLYGAKHPENALPDISFAKNFYDRTRDLIDQHDPDLLYFDNPLFPLGWAGMNLGAYFYNHSLKTHGGKMEGVVTIKNVPQNHAKAVVVDIERGLADAILQYPWQSETCIGEWHYQRELFNREGEYGGYLPPADVIHWLIDTVSKNGTFVLNVPGKPDGTIDRKEIAVVDGITAWMEVNGEAIYATRPWTVFGEGPNIIKSGSFQGDSIRKLGPKDIRFTRSKDRRAVYAIALGWPVGEFVIASLGTAATTQPGRIGKVELLGTGQAVKWTQQADGLHVTLPPNYRPTADFAAALKVAIA